ncbi:hypothetical protein LCGC14_2287020, partial [marine sediment metagenome]
EGAWDSIIKLSNESHNDMLNARRVPTLHLPEDDYAEGDDKAKGMLKMVANSDRDIARVWYHPEVKARPGEYADLPKFGYEGPNDSNNKAQIQQPGVSTGDYGNISKEWTRLTTVTGHTINYFMGNRAGATVGSETDKLADDEQETIDFAQIEIIIRKILDWLDSKGIITMPTEPFVIKFWKDWERIEKAAKLKLEEEEKFERDKALGLDTETEEIDSQDNEPKDNSIKKNMSYPMTSVSSTWVDKIGYDDVTDLLYAIFSGTSYSKPAPMGEWSFLDWQDAGSKGRYFWDYLSQRDPPWQQATIPDHLNRGVKGLEADEIIVDELSNKVPILDYKLIDSLDTETKIKNLGKKVDWGMGTGTATHIKEMLNVLKKNAVTHQLRFNTMNAEAFGNSIKEGYPLLYDTGDGVIVEEFICAKSWKENVGKIVPLGVYHNLD